MSDQAPQKDNGEKDIKLKLAGASYALGDVAMGMAAKARGGQDNVIKGAAIWFLGGAGAAFFGNPNKEMQLKILANRFEQHLKDKGISIPSDVRAQSELLKDKSFWDHTERFLYEHPSEILNASYAIGAVGLLADGMKEINNKSKHFLPKQWTIHNVRNDVSSLFWMGALILTGALAGLLIKEDPEAKKKAENGNILDKAVAFVTEKPLRVSGAFYTANNGFLALNVLQDWDKAKSLSGAAWNKNPHFFSTLQLACYLFSNTMLLMSPRDQVSKGGFSASDIGKLEEAAAQIISAQPKELQDILVKDMSAFMSKQAGITLKPEEIEKQLSDRLHHASTTLPAERRFAEREAQRTLSQTNTQSL